MYIQNLGFVSASRLRRVTYHNSDYTTENMEFYKKNGFYIDDRHFLIMLASDVSTRDGLGWQLFELVANELVLHLELFRHDDSKKLEFVTYNPVSIPFEALEIIVNDFSTKGGRDFIVD